MAEITLAADSTTLTLNGYVFTALASGDYLVLTPVNPHTGRTNTQNGGVSIQKRSDGDVYDLPIRVQKFSDDDIFLNSIINSQTATVLARSAKENFTKDGTDSVETYTLEGGSITGQPSNTKNDQDGNAVMEYTVQFRSAVRSL